MHAVPVRNGVVDCSSRLALPHYIWTSSGSTSPGISTRMHFTAAYFPMVASIRSVSIDDARGIYRSACTAKLNQGISRQPT